MLTEPQLDRMRTEAARALPGTAVVQSSVFTSDGAGSGDYVWTNAGTVACRMAPVTSAGRQEGMTGGRITPDAESVFTFPFNANVGTNDRILHAGGTFNVEHVLERSWNLTRRVEARRQT